METNFFQQAAAFTMQYGWRINIVPVNGTLVVSVLLYDPATDDKALKIVQTMNFNGTAKELDGGFFDAIAAPVKKTIGLLTNEREYTKSLDEAKKQSKQEQDKKGKQKPADTPKEITFETEMEKVEGLEGQGKFNEALIALPKADKYPDNANEIEEKRIALWEAIDKKDNNLFS